jgi:hypothetical protein
MCVDGTIPLAIPIEKACRKNLLVCIRSQPYFFVAITFRIANPIKEGPQYRHIWPFVLCRELNTVLGLSAGCFGTPFQL